VRRQFGQVDDTRKEYSCTEFEIVAKDGQKLTVRVDGGKCGVK